MSQTVLSIKDLSKLYRLGEVGTGTISHDLNRWWHQIRGKQDPYLKLGQENSRSEKGGDYVWALKDVSFDLKKGEVLGIVGKNGAGKSTLLKLLSRVTSPTKGSIKVKGRLASLLEVGTGFHPELTGKENIFLNGAILGMTRQDIKSRFDEIVHFAGVERYIDTPVKRYSSGMYVRLAFGVAAHLNSEILIVDEVLAVGDIEFQSKCLGKMKSISSSEGRTVLFVSHNMGAVKNLCTSGILMKNGLLYKTGTTSEIIDEYLSSGTESSRLLEWPEGSEPSTSELTVKSLHILDEKGNSDKVLTTEDRILIKIRYELHAQIKNLRVALNLFTSDGSLLFSTSDFTQQGESRLRESGNYESICHLPANFFNAGKYIVSIDFDIPLSRPIIMGLSSDFIITEVMENQLGMLTDSNVPGLIHPILKWDINRF
jgi:lipopolysaccharide transport system ATP-binding protein